MVDSQCRICLGLDVKKHLLVPISTELEENKLYEFINKISTVNIRLEDDLPQSICLSCLAKVEQTLAFKRLIEESDSKLREKLNQNNQDPSKKSNVSNQAEVEESQYETDLNIEIYEDVPEQESKESVRYRLEFNFQCCLCQKSFKLQNDLEEHCKTVHSHVYPKDHGSLSNFKSKRKFYCNLCGRSFRLKAFLTSHYADKDYIEPTGTLKSKKKEFICPVCSNNFDDKQAIQSHMTKTHPNYKPFYCDFPGCDKTFTIKPLLLRHQMYHKDKKFICDICARHFVTRAKLQKHRFVHTDKKPLQCSQCSKTFTYKHVLEAHVRTHLGKAFKCDQCQKAYKWKEDLRIHKLTEHMGIYPYKCQYCGKGYSGSSNKSYHEKKCTHRTALCD